MNSANSTPAPPAHDAQDRIFDQQLLQEPPTGRTEGHSQAHLAPDARSKRVNNRLRMFAQTISKSSPTAPMSISRAGRTWAYHRIVVIEHAH